MKAIVCEMCSSNDVIKQDGLYVCQSCGTKYTTEDAVKLMVDISGSSVKVDETDRQASYRKLAREARKMENVQKANEYYNQLVRLCPDDWEAAFFSVYYTSASCVIAQITPAAANVSSAVKQVAAKISNLPQNEKTNICNEIVTYTLLLKEAFLESATKHQTTYGTQSSYPEFLERKNAIYQMAKDAADAALLCGLKSRAVNIYESLVPAFGVLKVAKLVEALEPGRGVKMMTPKLEELKARQKKDRTTTVVMLVIFGIGLISLALSAALQIQGVILYLGVALAAFGALMSLIAIPINKASGKKVKRLEHEIAHLKD